MMAFWVHDLTNVQPTFKKIILKIWIWTIKIWQIMVFWIHGRMELLSYSHIFS
jgi:hypothetical protein